MNTINRGLGYEERALRLGGALFEVNYASD